MILWISTDFMHFKDSLKKMITTLSFSKSPCIPLLFILLFFYGREREGEGEDRGRESEREGMSDGREIVKS